MIILCPACSQPYELPNNQVSALVQVACPSCAHAVILDFEAANDPSLREAGHLMASGFLSREDYEKSLNNAVAVPAANHAPVEKLEPVKPAAQTPAQKTQAEAASPAPSKAAQAPVQPQTPAPSPAASKEAPRPKAQAPKVSATPPAAQVVTPAPAQVVTPPKAVGPKEAPAPKPAQGIQPPVRKATQEPPEAPAAKKAPSKPPVRNVAPPPAHPAPPAPPPSAKAVRRPPKPPALPTPPAAPSRPKGPDMSPPFTAVAKSGEPDLSPAEASTGRRPSFPDLGPGFGEGAPELPPMAKANTGERPNTVQIDLNAPPPGNDIYAPSKSESPKAEPALEEGAPQASEQPKAPASDPFGQALDTTSPESELEASQNKSGWLWWLIGIILLAAGGLWGWNFMQQSGAASSLLQDSSSQNP